MREADRTAILPAHIEETVQAIANRFGSSSMILAQ